MGCILANATGTPTPGSRKANLHVESARPCLSKTRTGGTRAKCSGELDKNEGPVSSASWTDRSLRSSSSVVGWRAWGSRVAQRGRRRHPGRNVVRCSCGRRTSLWIHGSWSRHGVAGLHVRRCGTGHCRTGSWRRSRDGWCRGPRCGRCDARNGRHSSPSHIRGRRLSRRRILFIRCCVV